MESRRGYRYICLLEWRWLSPREPLWQGRGAPTFHIGRQGTGPSAWLKRFKLTHRMLRTAVLRSAGETACPTTELYTCDYHGHWMGWGGRTIRETPNYSALAMVESWANSKLCQCPMPRAVRKHLVLRELGLFLITRGRTRTTENWGHRSRRVSEITHYRNSALGGWFGEWSEESARMFSESGAILWLGILWVSQ